MRSTVLVQYSLLSIASTVRCGTSKNYSAQGPSTRADESMPVQRIRLAERPDRSVIGARAVIPAAFAWVRS